MDKGAVCYELRALSTLEQAKERRTHNLSASAKKSWQPPRGCQLFSTGHCLVPDHSFTTRTITAAMRVHAAILLVAEPQLTGGNMTGFAVGVICKLRASKWGTEIGEACPKNELNCAAGGEGCA